MQTLQRTPKWVKSRRNAQIGDLVLLAQNKVVRNRWPMGRVVEVFTGEDGGVRSAQVKQVPFSTTLLARYACWRKLVMPND